MIWLLRHGDAEEAAPDPAAGDAARKLTQKGEHQAEIAGAALRALGVRLDACLASPKLRALETARIVAGSVDVDPIESEALRGGDFDPVEVAAGHGDDVLLVGHEPDFSRAIQAVTGARVKLKKGAIAAIEGRALICLLRPGELDAIAAAGRRGIR